MRRCLLLMIALALSGCTSSEGTDLDGDDDGADDAIETEGLVIEIALLGGPTRRLVTSDPEIADTDGDGLLDGAELMVWGSDPRDVDTDDDGLLDGEDAYAEGEKADAWRALGILEIDGLFLGEFDACPGTGRQLRAASASSDLPFPDGLTDGEEIRGWDVTLRGQTRRVTSDPCVPDTDDDRLLDHEERLAGTDPRSPDTDGDGAPDGSDADPLHDLALAFSEATVEGAASQHGRIVVTFGSRGGEIRWPGNGSVTLDIDDQTGDRAHLAANGIVELVDAEGRVIAGAILAIDLVEGTLSGAPADGDRILIAGEDARLTLRWSILRR